ncbi:MAG: PKD domain-containing protein, partial [Pontiellaceae bacterium]|nr:PKD domain-containing protein [Pontiellaceae bacterium]
CTISGNSADYYGGGMYYGTANHCTLSGNSAALNGGGMAGGTANNCTLSGNSASSRYGGGGGGIYSGTANNCTITWNSANYGGGMYNSTANHCTLSGNSAGDSGGGMYYGTANHCTLSGNSASSGGGMAKVTANHSIIYYNNAVDGNDLWNTAAFYSCSPDGMHGVDGNITNAPVLVSSSHIAADSPCRGAGSTNFVSGTDIDGEAWANPPSMGCDEPYETTGGDITVSFTSDGISGVLLPGNVLAFKGMVEGAALMHVWDFGDGTQVSNSLSVEHAWASAGTFNVVLTAYNADWPGGVSATQEVSVVSLEESVIHVSSDGDDANDGTSWTSAKKTIQAGVDAQDIPGGWILVESGTYSLSTTITVSKPVRIVSVDGPESTLVDGQGTVRCFGLGNSACVIEGLTITNGFSTGYGGGIYCSDTTPIVTHCILSGNSAGGSGGGMSGGTANHCTFSRNSARNGGGMFNGTANNCTLIGNSAIKTGGGIYLGTANNCIIYYNEATLGNDLRNTAASCSCSSDVVHGENGNITNAPVFVDAAIGDYRLAAGSPCIDAGSNAYVVGSLDLAGLPRIVGGVVDMGAYEYQGTGWVDEDGDSLPDDWETAYFGGTTVQGSGDDFDNDGIDNGFEWIAGTDPSDPNSVFTASISSNPVSVDGFVVEWLSVEDRVYSVLWRGSLTNANDLLQDGIEYPQNSYTDTLHNAESAGFYQIEVQLK